MVKPVASKIHHNSEELFPDDSDAGSDSAPEEVTFRDGQEKSYQIQKNTAEQIKVQKETLKRKRKEMHSKNKQQKEEKRKRLEEKRLPTEILEGLQEYDSEPVVDTSVKPVRKVFEDIESSDEGESSEAEKDISVHGSTVFKLKVLNDTTKKPRIPESISTFRKNALSRVRRVPTKTLIDKLERSRFRK